MRWNLIDLSNTNTSRAHTLQPRGKRLELTRHTHTHTHTPARTRTHTHTHARTHLKKARLPLIEVFVRGHVRCKRLSQEVQCIPLGSIPSQSQKQTGNTLTVDKKQAAQDDCDAPRHGVYLRPRVFVDTNVRVNIAYTGEEESTQTSTALRSNRTHHQCW
jgi:hypothetical protein